MDLLPYSVRGGHGRAFQELSQFVRDVHKAGEAWPDLLVVALDANCQGYGQHRGEIETVIGELSFRVVLAVPDPHIERWLLLDSAALNRFSEKAARLRTGSAIGTVTRNSWPRRFRKRASHRQSEASNMRGISSRRWMFLE